LSTAIGLAVFVHLAGVRFDAALWALPAAVDVGFSAVLGAVRASGEFAGSICFTFLLSANAIGAIRRQRARGAGLTAAFTGATAIRAAFTLILLLVMTFSLRAPKCITANLT
jgi:hypothetical protein